MKIIEHKDGLKVDVMINNQTTSFDSVTEKILQNRLLTETERIIVKMYGHTATVRLERPV